MKATRILLFLSPLLLLVPPLIPVNDSVGLALLDSFYKGMLGRFPGNAIMAFLCYTYARQLGRDAWRWVVGALAAPFLAPLVLAFMPPTYGSMADQQRRSNRRPAPPKAATGSFEVRFPLLSRYLANLPAEAAGEPKSRMEPVKANFEFSVLVPEFGRDNLQAVAAAQQFTLWMHPEPAGIRVFGAGMIAPPNIDNVTQWLRKSSPAKVATAVHPPEGPTKFFEYYPST